MATIKSFTDLYQSKKLAEILSNESADQTWERIAIAGANLNVPEEMQYRHNGDMPFQIYSGIGIPCWSLASLLGVLPKYELYNFGDTIQLDVNLEALATEGDETLLDLVVNMIIHLYEIKML